VKTLLERANGARPHLDGDAPAVMPFPPLGGARAGTPEPLEPPSRPVWDQGASAQAQPLRPADGAATSAAAPQVSLVSAFSALLAAEASNQPAGSHAVAATGTVSEASVEDAVRRVLVRMTDDLVRRIVLETAERLIREEIEKIKASPE
jgi:hypothetical protein